MNIPSTQWGGASCSPENSVVSLMEGVVVPASKSYHTCVEWQVIFLMFSDWVKVEDSGTSQEGQ